MLIDDTMAGAGRAPSRAMSRHDLAKDGGVVPTTAISRRMEQTWRSALATLGGSLEQPRVIERCRSTGLLEG